jgi:hypothetical protein
MELILFIVALVVLGMLGKQVSLVYVLIISAVFGLFAMLMIPFDSISKAIKRTEK